LKEETRKIGKIRMMNEKGYGFILHDQTNSIYFHAYDLVTAKFEELKIGTVVEFDVVETKRSLAAKNILVAEDL